MILTIRLERIAKLRPTAEPLASNPRVIMREFVEVYRHQQPFVAEMAMEALRNDGITCFMQEGAVTGLELSPVCPVAAPGVEYVVYVHRSILEKAKLIVDELPIDKELLNVSWAKHTDEKRKKMLWSYWAFVIIPSSIFLLLYLHKCTAN